ncbi:MAG: sarcosine oxidase subunit gamma [Neomegalonema sp.]|nr:sarcosine oxidase subunit gamma [Neomegalonema sp.]
MSTEARKSPLLGLKAPDGAMARLSEAHRRGMFTVKGDLADPALITAVQTAVGAPPPQQRKYVAAGECGAIWMAPDELLLLAPYGEVGAKVRLIEETTRPGACMAVDVSDARAVIQVAGQGAREMLAKVCPLDMHPSAFGPGDVRRSRIGSVAGAVVQVSGSPETFELYCFRSVADYVWELLCVAAPEQSRIGLFDNA